MHWFSSADIFTCVGKQRQFRWHLGSLCKSPCVFVCIGGKRQFRWHFRGSKELADAASEWLFLVYRVMFTRVLEGNGSSAGIFEEVSARVQSYCVRVIIFRMLWSAFTCVGKKNQLCRHLGSLCKDSKCLRVQEFACLRVYWRKTSVPLAFGKSNIWNLLLLYPSNYLSVRWVMDTRICIFWFILRWTTGRSASGVIEWIFNYAYWILTPKATDTESQLNMITRWVRSSLFPFIFEHDIIQCDFGGETK